MSAGDDTVSILIAQLARQAAPATLRTLATAIGAADWGNWTATQLSVVASVPQAHLRPRVRSLIDAWHNEQPTLAPTGMAAALRAAAEAVLQARGEQVVDLIWSGPTIAAGAFRRTDQALIEVIASAQRQLLVVSFTIYLTEAVEEALNQALARGVQIRCILETHEADGSPMSYNTIAALGPIAERVMIYVWPRDQRLVDPTGRSGRMHVKCALADRQMLFLSSANLTGAALNANMELGVLITGGSAPVRVASHFEQLISRGIVKQFQLG